MEEAQYWAVKDKAKNIVQCGLCPHWCVIAPDKNGICGARKNISGKLYSLSYNELTSINLDPIEKKPLYHFYPGSKILSVGSFGCNFKCSFCQNWEISQSKAGETPTKTFDSGKIINMAFECGSIGVAYTYNEPLVNYEWVKDTAKAAKAGGLVNVLVSNGYINTEPLKELMPFIDGANIDIKSFKESFYNKLCRGKLAPVLETVTAMVKSGVHVEITTLLIPGENDAPEEIEKLTDWLAGLNPEIPLHFSKYFPSYNMEKKPTALGVLETAWSIAKKKLKNVYVGNISDPEYSRTICPDCGDILIERDGYAIKMKKIEKGRCLKCGHTMSVITNYINQKEKSK